MSNAPRPVRLRLQRVKDFRLQDHSRAVNGLPAVNCARPSKFGNPFTIKQLRELNYRGSDLQAAEHCVNSFNKWLASGGTNMWWMGAKADAYKARIIVFMPTLRGKNLACYCKLCARHAATSKPLDEECPDCAPCHVDVLGRMASRLSCKEVAP